jgi:hypothetical protein
MSLARGACRAVETVRASTEVFVSYAREDRDTAQALAAVLEADGHAVWWDRELGGGSDFSLEIERELTAARLAIVLWSQASVQSGFVRDESARARDAGKLLPLRIEAEVALPLGFGNLHTLDLIDWDGEADDDACRALRDEVRRQLRRAPQGLAGTVRGRGEGAALRRSLAWRRWRAPLGAAVGAVLIAAGVWWWLGRDDGAQEAQVQLARGLAAHFDAEPNLELARNAYLAALRAKADFAPAHFYLAHVYALLQLPGDARTHFETALANANQLDPPQRQDTRKQLQAIVALLEAPPPVASPAPAVIAAAAPSPVPAPAPAPAVAAAPPPTAALPSSPASVGGVAAAAAAVPSALVRTAPSEAQQRVAAKQAEALFAGDRQAQLTAATTLALDATLAGDALPKVLAHTLETLRTGPGSTSAREAVAQSLRLLQSASPSLLREHVRAAQRVVDAGAQLGGSSADAAADVRARLAKAAALKPFVFVQIGDERQRALAQGVVARLAAMGYGAPGIENVGSARVPARTEVRVQGTSDPALARWIAQHLGKLVQAEVAVKALRQAKVGTDTYEIWFEKDLCLTRVVPACEPS